MTTKSLLTLLFLLTVFRVGAQTTDRLPCVDKRFSIVAHIFRDSLGSPNISESLILSEFAKANTFFSPICISFEVCEFRYHSNFEYDFMNRKTEMPEIFPLYNQKNCINIYFVLGFEYEPTLCGGAQAGIAILNTGGVVITKGCTLYGYGKWLANELGRYFSLSSTYQNHDELVNGSNCATAGDQICDTPADPYIDGMHPKEFIDDNCHFHSMVKDANGNYYDPIVGNIMSSYYSSCLCGFTHDQLEKMANYYLVHKGMW